MSRERQVDIANDAEPIPYQHHLTLEQRVEKLEKDARYWRYWTIALLCFIYLGCIGIAYIRWSPKWTW